MNIPEFKDKKILEQVFIHRSYLNETKLDIESNERLEFLGDSILSFAISSYIYKQNAQLQEGALTNLRSVLTNTQTLYEIAKMLNLGALLKLSHGEEAGNGRENKTTLGMYRKRPCIGYGWSCLSARRRWSALPSASRPGSPFLTFFFR